jgi:DNA polymerase I-like protein with 3'-5' exonuclease and polymerase domains
MSFLGIDSETNGLFAYHGCELFGLSLCHSEDGSNEYWDFNVDTKTRQVNYITKKIKQIRDAILDYSEFTFHNSVFDLIMIRKLPTYGRQIFNHIVSKGFHDTMFSSHLVNSKDPKGLKDQCLLYCNILDTDEKLLDEHSKKARTIAKQLGWAIATEDIPSLAGQSDKFHKCDMWIPKQLAIFKKYAKDHPWLTSCETYCNLDTWRSVCLRTIHKQWLEENPEYKAAYEENLRTVLSVIAMQDHGITIQKDHFLPEYRRAKQIRDKAISEMRTQIGDPDFNYNSSKQLPYVLFKKLKFKPIKKTKSGASWSTDKEVLPELRVQKPSPKATKFLETLLTAKEVQAAVTYMESYQRYELAGNLHPSFNIVGTSTVRFSSQNPNGQNIGKGKEEEDEHGNKKIKYSIRKIFGPPKGRVWLATDYDQLQLRIFAYWSKEEKLIEAFKKGFDFHTYVAMLIYETDSPTKIQRRVAKNVNFGYIFGAGENKIDSTAGIPGLFRRVQQLFPNVTESINRTVSFVKRHGYVKTASGYKLTVDKRKAYAGVNYIVQGTEGDIVKKALNDCFSFLSRKYDLEPSNCLNDSPIKLVLQVHDEIIFSIPEKFRLRNYIRPINRIMENAGTHYGIVCKCKPELYYNNWSEPTEATEYLSS